MEYDAAVPEPGLPGKISDTIPTHAPALEEGQVRAAMELLGQQIDRLDDLTNEAWSRLDSVLSPNEAPALAEPASDTPYSAPLPRAIGDYSNRLVGINGQLTRLLGRLAL